MIHSSSDGHSAIRCGRTSVSIRRVRPCPCTSTPRSIRTCRGIHPSYYGGGCRHHHRWRRTGGGGQPDQTERSGTGRGWSRLHARPPARRGARAGKSKSSRRVGGSVASGLVGRIVLSRAAEGEVAAACRARASRAEALAATVAERPSRGDSRDILARHNSVDTRSSACTEDG